MYCDLIQSDLISKRCLEYRLWILNLKQWMKSWATGCEDVMEGQWHKWTITQTRLRPSLMSWRQWRSIFNYMINYWKWLKPFTKCIYMMQFLHVVFISGSPNDLAKPKSIFHVRSFSIPQPSLMYVLNKANILLEDWTQFSMDKIKISHLLMIIWWFQWHFLMSAFPTRSFSIMIKNNGEHSIDSIAFHKRLWSIRVALKTTSKSKWNIFRFLKHWRRIILLFFLLFFSALVSLPSDWCC